MQLKLRVIKNFKDKHNSDADLWVSRTAPCPFHPRKKALQKIFPEKNASGKLSLEESLIIRTLNTSLQL